MSDTATFPSELVEAAAKALADSDTGYFLPYRGERDAALTVLAAVLPLIEQRVIDRLAAQGGKNPYIDGDSIPTWAAWEAWDEGAACGVAAERARCPLCNHEWRRHDPEDGRCDCHSETIIGPCQCGRDIVWMQERIAAMSLAALAPERTGEGNDA